jgi:hypothetical protein
VSREEGVDANNREHMRRIGVTGNNSGGGGGNGCQRASGEQCRALETPRSGRRASR